MSEGQLAQGLRRLLNRYSLHGDVPADALDDLLDSYVDDIETSNEQGDRMTGDLDLLVASYAGWDAAEVARNPRHAAHVIDELRSRLSSVWTPRDLTAEERRDLVNGAVAAILPNVVNETQAYNVWNNLASDRRFVQAILAFNAPRLPTAVHDEQSTEYGWNWVSHPYRDPVPFSGELTAQQRDAEIERMSRTISPAQLFSRTRAIPAGPWISRSEPAATVKDGTDA